MEILETRQDEYIVMTKSGHVAQVAKTPYIELKLGYFKDEQIVIKTNQGTIMEGSDREEEQKGLLCIVQPDGNSFWFNDHTLFQVMLEIMRGNRPISDMADIIMSLSVLHWIGINIPGPFEHDRTEMRVGRNGDLNIPALARISVMEHTQYHDGAKVAKIHIDLHRAMHHYNQNDFYALIGRDEVDQFWMHFLPPEYMVRDIAACELWLCGGKEGDTIIFSPTGYHV